MKPRSDYFVIWASSFLRHSSFVIRHFLILSLAAAAHAQSGAWPFSSPKPGATTPGSFPSALSPSSSAQEAPPPREVPLVEKKWEQLSDTEPGPLGKLALAIRPEKWKHAETDNFVVHYRRVTEAQKVVREVEYNLWFVAKSLGATKDRYRKKSHVFVFQDEAEWKKFLAETPVPQWSASFAFGDDLFLNIREDTGQFDSHTLAHETTHAVIARLYRGKRWPLWLNEGFAEYMGGASVAARKGQTARYHQQNLSFAEMPLEQLMALTVYPQEMTQVAQLYQSSEKFVRFLFNELPKDRFPKFVDTILGGKDGQSAFMEVYGDKFRNFDAFKRRYERFTK